MSFSLLIGLFPLVEQNVGARTWTFPFPEQLDFFEHFVPGENLKLLRNFHDEPKPLQEIPFASHFLQLGCVRSQWIRR